MGIGSPDIAERGKKTRFSGENAAEMGRRGNAVRQANAPIRKCLKQIATEALYGHPPVANDTLRKVAKFYKIKTAEVTFAHVALFKQASEMAKGDPGAFNLVASYAGEKPAEKVEVSTPDFTELQAAFDAEGPGADLTITTETTITREVQTTEDSALHSGGAIAAVLEGSRNHALSPDFPEYSTGADGP